MDCDLTLVVVSADLQPVFVLNGLVLGVIP
jgi:hypothetical protein